MILKTRLTFLFLFLSFFSSKAQSNDSIKVFFAGEFMQEKEYAFAFNDFRTRITTPKGVYGECFKFELSKSDIESGFLSIDLGEVGFFGRFIDETLNVQLFDKRVLVLYNDKSIRKKKYFNAYWVDSLNPHMLIPELYGVLKELKLECE